MAAVNKTVFSGVTYGVMGMGTEGGATPYRLTVAAAGGWGGTPVAMSGYSVGAMQFDFGQRGKAIDPQTGKSYSESFIDAVNEWSRQSKNTPLSSEVSAQLATKGGTLRWLSEENRATISAFGDTAAGKAWINSHLEKGLISEYEAKIAPVLNNTAFNDWSESDILVATAVLTKAANQSPNVGFAALAALTKKNHEGDYTLSNFLADTMQVEATNRNYHFTKAAGIAKDYVALRESPEFGPIIESAERKIADPDFTPASIGSDRDLWFMRKINSDSKFRTDLKVALTQLEDSDGHPYVITAEKSQIVLVPEDDYVEIMAPKGKQSVIVKNSEAFFYPGGDAEGRRNALYEMENYAVSATTTVANSPISPFADHLLDIARYALVARIKNLGEWVWSSITPSVKSTPSDLPADLPQPVTEPPSNHTTTGAIYLSRDGASATFPNGQVINAGPGGRLELGADGNLSAMRPVSGYNLDEKVYSITLYGKGGQITTNAQVQVLADPTYSDDPSRSITFVQGQTRDIIQVQPDGSNIAIKTVFQTGFGWFEQGTGELVQSIAEWRQERSVHTSAPPVAPIETSTAVNQAKQPEYPEQTDPPEQPEQSDQDGDLELNAADLTVPDLVSRFTGTLNPGAYGAGQFLGFDVLPLNENSNFLVNADGDMVAELTKLPTGYYQLKDLGGNALYISEQNGRGYTADEYERAQQTIQIGGAANAVGLMNSIIGLQHWDNMSDLQRTAAALSIYNAVDRIAGGALPGDWGTAASVLGLMNALETGNVGGMLVSGISVVNAFSGGAASKAIGEALGMPAGNVVPCLSLLLALDSGDPLSIAAAAANFIPVYGQVISLAITVLGGLFGGGAPDIPMREGLAHAEWDAAGNVVVVTDQDVEDGGATATEWMKSVVNGLQAQLAATRDVGGNAAYALVPGLLPAIGFQYDPDGLNLANGAKGYVYLKWVDERGETQTRYYDGAGSRGDGSGETLAGDFMQHAARAIAPAWQVQTVWAHYQQGDGLGVLPDAAAGLPRVLADGLHQAFQAITFTMSQSLPDETAQPQLQQALADIDGDGYLEQTQWLAAGQQALAVDANGDGVIDANELLSLGGTGPTSLHSMNWLDANNDKLLDARDPAFAALRVWVDADASGSSAGGGGMGSDGGNAETQTLAEAGIVAIDFGSNPPAAVRADGSRTLLIKQQLVGDVLGVQYQAVVGGVLQLDEQLSGVAVATLHGVNTREFDGLAEHMHGGEAALNVDGDGFINGENPAGHAVADTAINAVVNAGDERLVSTTAHTLATQSAQTRTTLIAAGDPRLRTATGTGAVAAFTPLGSAGLGAQVRDAQEALARSADVSNLTPLLALAVGAAVQWPAQASAAPPPGQPGADGAAPAGQAGADTTGWQIWDGPAAAQNLQHPQPEANPLSAGTATSMSLDTNPASSATAAGEIYASNWPLAQDAPWPAAPDLIANGASDLTTPTSIQASTQPFSSLSDGEAAPALAQATGPMATEVQLKPPQVQGEQAATLEDTGLRFLESQLLANDSTPYTPAQPGATVLRITSVFAAEHGSVSLQVNALGGTEVVFLPEANYNGLASFRYTVTDSYGLCSDASVTLNISAVNDAPTVLGETATGDEDTTLLFTTGGLLANDSDIDNPQADLRIVSVDNAVHGAVSLQDDGTIRFVPDVDYFGDAQFTYTVADGVGGFTVGLASLKIAPVNDAPRLADDAATLDEDTEARFTAAALLANDADIDNPHSDLTITAVGNASHGSVQLVDGEIVFTPDINFNGTASFSYTVSDGFGGAGGVGGVSGLNGESQATVTLTFNPVNDAPVTNDELLWGKRDVSYTLTQAALLANDMDAESPTALLRISAVSNAQHGTAVLGADGSVRFVPEAGYAGRGSFDYLVQDPEGATTTATAQIDFSHININPLATDDGFIGYEDIAFNITAAQLLVNDSDADNAAGDLRVSAVANAQNGTVLLQADGSVRFVPVANFYGTASFQYQVSDGDGGRTWATARLNVQSVNDAPVIEDIWYGRPLYGFAADVPVHDEAWARELASTGSLLNRTVTIVNIDREGYVQYAYDYTVVTPSYYRNGAMRPISMDPLDAGLDSNSNPFKWHNGSTISAWSVDDPYRQNGGVVAYDPDGNSASITLRLASGPQHGHAWANQYTSLNAPSGIDHTQAAAYAVAQSGAWQYYSHQGDPYAGADPFTLIVTDGGGASTTVTINTSHVGLGAGGGGGKPVTLDLDGNGLQYVGLDDSQAYFDLNHDGWRERLAWVGEGDALLARDIGGDGVIERADEISFTGYLPGARTDLEGLAAFDSNGNGLLDRLDARWQEFGAWRDTHGDGVSAPGEFISLDDIGITQIDLRSDQQVRQFDGVTELGQSRFTWADGRTGAVGDVAFAADGSDRLPASHPTPLAPPTSLTPEHMALLMAQVISTATAAWEMKNNGDGGEGMPLGYVEPQGGHDAGQALAATQAQWVDAAQAQAAQLHGLAS